MIPLFKVHHPTGIGNIIEDIFKSGFVSEGEYSDKFEKDFSIFIDNPNTCMVNSCTSALSLAAHLIDLSECDEVITTAMTCMATNTPFYHTGAKLVFADIDPTTGNIDPEDVQRKITSRTRAIVGVHWAGQPFDLDSMNSIAKNANVSLVEDSAHALGATYNGKKIGNNGDFTCFSFQAIKHLTTVDGGAISCKYEADAIDIRKTRWFGIDRKYTGQSKWEQDIYFAGFKMHMNNVNAAIGLEQMKHIDSIISKHRQNGKYFDENIDNKRITKLKRDPKSESSYWIYSILVDDREDFKKYLHNKGIASDRVHVRNDFYSVFKRFRNNKLHGLTEFDSKLINIPVGWWLTEDDVRYIVKCVNEY